MEGDLSVMKRVMHEGDMKTLQCIAEKWARYLTCLVRVLDANTVLNNVSSKDRMCDENFVTM